jgi:hypothetical protein
MGLVGLASRVAYDGALEPAVTSELAHAAPPAEASPVRLLGTPYLALSIDLIGNRENP